MRTLLTTLAIAISLLSGCASRSNQWDCEPAPVAWTSNCGGSSTSAAPARPSMAAPVPETAPNNVPASPTFDDAAAAEEAELKELLRETERGSTNRALTQLEENLSAKRDELARLTRGAREAYDRDGQLPRGYSVKKRAIEREIQNLQTEIRIERAG